MSVLDRLLGRVSMYRLTVGALATVLLAAVIAAATDLLFYDPLAILATAAVAISATAVSTLVAARVAGARPQLESSVITGLILTFLLWPSLSGADLLAAAVAGAVAGVSKFLFAWRGRHILNPAALGAVVVVAAGLGASVWWVGSEVLLPVVLLAAAVIAVRTRRIGFLCAYVVPAVALTVVGYLLAGTPVADALRWTLTSSPVFFLAGFMLSEPLTQPPRGRQRVVVAVVVAVVGALPLLLAPLGIHGEAWPVPLTPELGLLVGNLVAFAFGQRRRIALRVHSHETRGDQHELGFDVLDHRGRPRPLRALPGQYLELELPHARPDARGRRRALSIASAPGADRILLATRVPEPASTFKRELTTLAPGTVVSATGVWGDFLLPEPGEPVALVAGGIGITPFLAHLAAPDQVGGRGGSDRDGSERDGSGRDGSGRDGSGRDGSGRGGSGRDGSERGGSGTGAGQRPGRDIVLLHAVEHPGQAVDPASITGAAVVLVCPVEPEHLPPGWRWVRGRLNEPGVLTEAITDLGDRTVLVSGPPAMVSAVSSAARSAGARRVRTDTFIGC